jgi:hypothetical protein
VDILTHIGSGVAGAIVVAAFSKKQPLNQLKILVAGAVGGAFPDIDSISMWSHFNSTFGKLFHLSNNGKVIYSGKFWYSHHAFFHSLVAALLFAVIFGLLSYGIYKTMSRTSVGGFKNYCKNCYSLAIAFITGYLLHLFGDMPTPASGWGGVNLFFPANHYIGGSGKIWWWNNYDIFLLIALDIVITGILLFAFKRHFQRTVIVIATVLTLLFVEIQINTRQYNYAYSGNSIRYGEMEEQSKREQERILGRRIYSLMDRLDKHLPMQF